MGYGRDEAHFSLAYPGRELAIYNSLDDAMQAAEDPYSVQPLEPREAE